MKAVELKTETAEKSGYYSWIAARDAQFKSACESQNYSDKQKLVAERMKLALELCYYNKNIYITFRKKFISIKIDQAQIKDRKNLALLETDYDNAGYSKIVSKQGVSYRIPKI